MSNRGKLKVLVAFCCEGVLSEKLSHIEWENKYTSSFLDGDKLNTFEMKNIHGSISVMQNGTPLLFITEEDISKAKLINHNDAYCEFIYEDFHIHFHLSEYYCK